VDIPQVTILVERLLRTIQQIDHFHAAQLQQAEASGLTNIET
jgi:hypothetical protein